MIWLRPVARGAIVAGALLALGGAVWAGDASEAHGREATHAGEDLPQHEQNRLAPGTPSARATQAHQVAAGAGDGISAVAAPDGRTIFVNTADTPQPAPTRAKSARVGDPGRSHGWNAGVRYIYWSNTEHRWKPVPGQSALARRARTAAVEALTQVDANNGRQPGTDGKSQAAQPADSNQPNAAVQKETAITTGARLNEAIEQAASRNNVDPDLVRAVIKVESNFNPHAVSRKGAMGLMQLMPETARSLNVAHPFDPGENVDAGVRHLRQLLDNYGGNLALTLAAYNAGAGSVAAHNGVPPYRETRSYIREITTLYKNGGVAGAPARHPIHVSRDAEGHLMFTNTD